MSSARTIRFQRVEQRVERYGACPVCGKCARRSMVIEETVSPYHPAVSPGMSLDDAHAAVALSIARRADSWTPDFTHGKCREGQRRLLRKLPPCPRAECGGQPRPDFVMTGESVETGMRAVYRCDDCGAFWDHEGQPLITERSDR